MTEKQALVLKTICTIILPPAGVFLREGVGAQLIINVLLTLLGYVPGLIHGLYILLRK